MSSNYNYNSYNNNNYSSNNNNTSSYTPYDQPSETTSGTAGASSYSPYGGGGGGGGGTSSYPYDASSARTGSTTTTTATSAYAPYDSSTTTTTTTAPIDGSSYGSSYAPRQTTSVVPSSSSAASSAPYVPSAAASAASVPTVRSDVHYVPTSSSTAPYAPTTTTTTTAVPYVPTTTVPYAPTTTTTSAPYAPTTAATGGAPYGGGGGAGLVSQGNPTKCHKVDYEIKGHEMQLVEVELDPSETVIAEAGAMLYLEDGVEFKTKFGDGSEPSKGFFSKLMSAGGRLLTGESLFLTHFTNKGSVKARAAFAAPFPGTIVPIDMARHGEEIVCQKDAFLCAAMGTSLKMHLHKRLGSGLFGGEGFLLQKLKGDGVAFVHAGGTVVERRMRGEKLRLDTGCLVAFTSGVDFDVQLAPGLKTMFFGGEGLFLATLRGHGTVWIQSLPFSRLADRVAQQVRSNK